MSISIPGADYTPQLTGYTGQGAFRFWCQKVLPIVYDDSLSYYELLNKVVNYLNNVIADVASVENNIEQLNTSYINLQKFVNDTNDSIEGEINNFEDYMQGLHRDFVQLVTEKVEQLEGFVEDYFDNLNVQNEINYKLDKMATDGSLSALISPLIAEEAPAIITEWMRDNITPTTPVIDRTLSVENAAADAKVTGDRINANSNNIDALAPRVRASNFTWRIGDTIDDTGEIIGVSTYAITNRFMVQSGSKIYNHCSEYGTNDVPTVMSVAFWDSNNNFISRVNVLNGESIIVPNGATGCVLIYGYLYESGNTVTQEDVNDHFETQILSEAATVTELNDLRATKNIENLISVANYATRLPDLNLINTNSVYRLNFGAGTNGFPLHSPYANGWGSAGTVTLITSVRTEGNVSIGDTQVFISSDGVYTRYANNVGWVDTWARSDDSINNMFPDDTSNNYTWQIGKTINANGNVANNSSTAISERFIIGNNTKVVNKCASTGLNGYATMLNLAVWSADNTFLGRLNVPNGGSINTPDNASTGVLVYGYLASSGNSVTQSDIDENFRCQIISNVVTENELFYKNLTSNGNIMISVENFNSVLPDLDSVNENKVYRLNFAVGSTTIPLHSPYANGWKSKGVATVITSVAHPGVITIGDTQVFVGSDGVYTRFATRTAWQNWEKVSDCKYKKTIVVDPSGGGDYTSFTEGVVTGYVNFENAYVYVKRGVYDAIQETKDFWGEDIFDNWVSGYGPISLRKNIHVFCEPGTVLVAHYTGTNANVMMNYSPVNFWHEDAVLENLTIQASRVRYCVHDDQWDYEGFYHHKTKNCRFKIDNTGNTAWDRRLAYGGGLASNALI